MVEIIVLMLRNFLPFLGHRNVLPLLQNIYSVINYVGWNSAKPEK